MGIQRDPGCLGKGTFAMECLALIIYGVLVRVQGNCMTQQRASCYCHASQAHRPLLLCATNTKNRLDVKAAMREMTNTTVCLHVTCQVW